MPYDAARPLFSIHVPKTAGNSVRWTLERWFGHDNVLPHYGDPRTDELPTRWTPGPGQCVHGHFDREGGFGALDYYPNAAQFITFLRDPFDRHVSLYFYLKKHSAVTYFEGRPFRILDRCPTLSAYLDLVCGSDTPWWARSELAFFPAALTSMNWRDQLAGFLHIGIAEQLDRSLAILAGKLAFSQIKAVKFNTSDHDEHPDLDQVRARHRARFSLEHEIYAWARTSHETDSDLPVQRLSTAFRHEHNVIGATPPAVT